MTPQVRINSTHNICIELDRTAKYARCIMTSNQGVRGIHKQPLTWSELIGFKTNKKLVPFTFDTEWKPLQYDLKIICIKWLESHNNNYHALTDRAKKELIMLLLINSSLNSIQKFADGQEAMVMDKLAQQGDYVAKCEKDLVAFTGAELVAIYVACGGKGVEAANLIKKSKAHIAQAIWAMAEKMEVKVQNEKPAKAEKTTTSQKKEKEVTSQTHPRIHAVVSALKQGGSKAEIMAAAEVCHEGAKAYFQTVMPVLVLAGVVKEENGHFSWVLV